MTKNFALIGAAGYIAPRHMRAIKDTGNVLVAAMDTNDSVGIIDSHFPNADYFVEFERFDRHVDNLRRNHPDSAIDYVSICSPNHLHDAHMRFGLRNDASVICEKPLVLEPDQIDELQKIEKESAGKVNTILQLRLHPSIIKLREKVQNSDKIFDVRLTYLTSRGPWYDVSWKGDSSRSGGIATNIGVHFFDMLHWVFGPSSKSELHFAQARTNAGLLHCERARIQWLLSVDENRLPESAKSSGMRTFRNIEIDGEELEFSGGFTDLHTRSYEAILAGKGFTLEDNRAAVESVAKIRTAKATGLVGDYHPALKSPLKNVA